MAVTTSRLPNRETFLEWPDFCLVVAKLRSTCNGWKRQDLDARYPKMCNLLSLWPQWAQNGRLSCHSIQAFLGRQNATAYHTLTTALYNYARENLALVNIYIKQPVVTKILRDQRIPIIWFVANCGGILGLCMGFSIVTVFEVLHCLAKTSFASISKWYSKLQTTTAAPKQNTTNLLEPNKNTSLVEDTAAVVIRMEPVQANHGTDCAQPDVNHV